MPMYESVEIEKLSDDPLWLVSAITEEHRKLMNAMLVDSIGDGLPTAIITEMSQRPNGSVNLSVIVFRAKDAALMLQLSKEQANASNQGA